MNEFTDIAHVYKVQGCAMRRHLRISADTVGVDCRQPKHPFASTPFTLPFKNILHPPHVKRIFLRRERRRCALSCQQAPGGVSMLVRP